MGKHFRPTRENVSKFTSGANWWESNPDAAQALAAIGVSSDEDYLAARSGLEGKVRQAADAARLRHGTSKHSPSPSLIIHWCPPEYRQWDIHSIELPTRVRRCLQRADVKQIGELKNWSDSDLLDLPNFGNTSLRQLYRRLVKGAARCILDVQKAYSLSAKSHAQVNKVLSPKAPGGSQEKDQFNLFASFRQFLSSLNERDRSIIEQRFGISGTVETLEHIAKQFGVTRERIRQVESRKTTILRGQYLPCDVIVSKVNDLLQYRDDPLYLASIAGEDPWFAGFEGIPLVLSHLLDTASDGEIAVFDVNGLRVVTRANRTNYESALRETRIALEKLVSSRPRRSEVEVTAEAIAGAHGCAELWQEMLVELKEQSFYSASGEGEERLVAFGRSAGSLVLAIMEDAEFPMHYEDIHAQAEKLGGRSLDVRRVHSAASEVGILLGRGTYGSWKHVNLRPSAMRSILDFVENLISNSDVARQWHCRELLDEIQVASLDVPEDLDQYTLNAVLSKSNNLDYLGRMVWQLKDDSGSSVQERVDVRQAILSIIRSHGRAMSTEEVRRRLEEHRGLSENFQIHPRDDLVRLGPGRWGLLERDVPVSSSEAQCVLDWLAGELEQLGHGLTDVELVRALEASDFNLNMEEFPERFWMFYAAKDRRFRVSESNLIWLREWKSPARTSAEEAVRAVLIGCSRPLSVSEIANEASVVASRRISVQTVYGLLRQIGARYSDELRGWTPPQ